MRLGGRSSTWSGSKGAPGAILGDQYGDRIHHGTVLRREALVLGRRRSGDSRR